MKATECTIENCIEPTKFKGLCSYHYYRKRNKGDSPPHPSTKTMTLQICEVMDCPNKVQAALLCEKHYRKYRRRKSNGKVSTVIDFVVKQAIKNNNF